MSRSERARTGGPSAGPRRLRATYRLQLRDGADLEAARALVPYLARLGVSHLYLSPVLRARAGSAHGYDGVDPTAVDPALGGERALVALARALHAQGLGMILDVVPNHLAADPESPFFADVLAHGRASAYADWYDVDWKAGARPRLDLPFLGAPLAEVLGRGELAPERGPEGLRLRYFERAFPLDPATWPALLRPAAQRLRASGPVGRRVAERLRPLVRRLAGIPPASRADENARLARAGAREDAAAHFAALEAAETEAGRVLDAALAALAEGAAGKRRIARLLARQPYRLGFWRRLRHRMNYRRFFDVNELVALRAEVPEVFDATHARLLDAVADGLVDGLRIDHVDGLADPEAYLRRLRHAADARAPEGAPRPFPILVEKILAPGERLPERWPVQGTTGYEFAARIEAALLDAAGTARMHADWRRATGGRGSFREVAVAAKRKVLAELLEADVRRAAEALAGQAAAEGRPVPGAAALRSAVLETAAHLEVYRSYLPADGPAPSEDRARLERALAGARAARRAPERGLSALEGALLAPPPRAPAAREARARTIARFEQLAAPAAAKGVEDTALYRYTPLLSQNEVGAEPEAEPKGATSALHADARERLARGPGGLLAASTHDSKRSADVRARLDVLTEIPDRFEAAMQRLHARARALTNDGALPPAPEPATERFLYQTLVGVWPLAEGDTAGVPPDVAGLESLRERVVATLEKSVREAKERTDWLDPDPEYETELRGFVSALLRDAAARSLRAEIAGLVAAIARPGLWNALARTAVQLASPGVPDVYQGDELFRLSLVDPDNRRPVDFARRARLLESLEAEARRGPEALAALARAVADAPEDGRAKLHLIRTGFAARRRDPALFLDAPYRPLAARGARAAHAIAFARCGEDRALLCVAPRLPLRLVGGASERAPTGAVWEETALPLPRELAGRCLRSLLTGATLEAGAELPCAELLADFPVGLWATPPDGAAAGGG